MMHLFLILSILNYTIPNREIKINSFLSERWLRLESDSLVPDFIKAVEDVGSISDLYLLDSLVLLKGLYSKSDFIEGELLNLIKDDDEFIHSTISRNYLKRGILDLEAGIEEKGIRELRFSLLVDPSRRIIPIILMKYNFPIWGEVFKNLKEYFYTYIFLDNWISIIVKIMSLITIFLGTLYIAIVISGLFKSVPFLSEWVRQRMKISSLWIPALLFSLFVWLPILTFLAILIGISLIKLRKKSYIRLAIISFIFPLILAYTFEIKLNFSSNSPAYHSYKSRYDPYNYSIDEVEFPYGYAVKGVEMAMIGESSKAESLFEKGYENNESLIFLVNLSSLYFSENNYNDALAFSEKVVSIDPDNPIANLTMATIYLDRLDFEVVSKYIEIATKSGYEFAERELPIYQYPPDSWLLSEIFKVGGMGKFIKESKLYFFFILAVFFTVLSSIRRVQDEYCPICGRVLINSIKIEEKKVCDICAERLSMTESKSIRERLKRYTRRKSDRIALFKYFVMNLIFPGSAHIYGKKWLSGMVLLLLGSLLLFIYIGPFYSQSEEIMQYEISVGNNIFIYFIIFYYLLVLFLTWRLSTNGDRG